MSREPALDVLAEPGWRLLVAAGIAVDEAGVDAPLAAAELLRKRAGDSEPELRAAALELVTEGRRLAAKLGLDERLIAVRGAVEQATPGRVATWHATQVPEGCRLLEIGCGCGGDTLALAHRAGNVIATDLDPVRAACAHTNLVALGLGAARAIPGDGFAVLEDEGARADVVFADPDRRPDGRRTRDPESWRPPLSRVLALAPRRCVFVKAAPSLDPDDSGGTFSVAYLSHRGECLEAFLSSEGPAGKVRAVLLPEGAPQVVLQGDRGPCAERPLGEALYVPDPAAIRASLLAELGRRHALGVVSEGLAFLTGPSGAASPWLRAYAVLDALPLRPKDVRAALRAQGARRVRVHSRGVALRDPELERDLAKALDRAGGGPELDVFATRVGGAPTAVLTVRCD